MDDVSLEACVQQEEGSIDDILPTQFSLQYLAEIHDSTTNTIAHS